MQRLRIEANQVRLDLCTRQSGGLLIHIPAGLCYPVNILTDKANIRTIKKFQLRLVGLSSIPWRLIFVSASTFFSTTSSHVSKSYFWLFIYTWMKERSRLQKYCIVNFSLRVAAGLNSLKTACKCFRYADQSKVFPSWY